MLVWEVLVVKGVLGAEVGEEVLEHLYLLVVLEVLVVMV
jgi:hypothetical protein